jgi:hypothetical protein
MPTIQVNGLVVTMAYISPRIYLSVANHAPPGHTACRGIGIDEPVVLGLSDAGWIRRANHDGKAGMPHQLFANMRLAATATAERLIPMNHPGVFMHLGRRNREPLSLPDRLAAFHLRGAKTRDRGPYIVNTVTRHRGGEPVTLITAEQELILVVAVTNDQYKMARSRPHIKNLGNNPVLTANIEKFAIAIPGPPRAFGNAASRPSKE